MIQSILFVSLGDICRSPAAVGFFQLQSKGLKGLESLRIRSAGIGDWHEGRLPDSRTCKAAQKRGVSLTNRSKLFRPSLFSEYDLILATDQSVLHELYKQAQTMEDKSKIRLLSEFSSYHKKQEIPDPFLKDIKVLERALDMIEESCQGLVEVLVFTNRKVDFFPHP